MKVESGVHFYTESQTNLRYVYKYLCFCVQYGGRMNEREKGGWACEWRPALEGLERNDEGQTQTRLRTTKNTNMTHIHTQTHKQTHALWHVRVCTRTRTLAHARTHTHSETNKHSPTHMFTYIHAHTPDLCSCIVKISKTKVNKRALKRGNNDTKVARQTDKVCKKLIPHCMIWINTSSNILQTRTVLSWPSGCRRVVSSKFRTCQWHEFFFTKARNTCRLTWV